MAGNSIGQLFRVTTFGESHGLALGCIVDGVPPGIELTEGFAMYPAAAVSGWYFSHPRSQYFVVGRLTREQVEDYAKRKGWTLAEAERWLAPNLDYDVD